MKKGFSVLLFFLISLGVVAQEYTEPLKQKLDSVFDQTSPHEPGGFVFVQKGNELLYYKPFGVANISSKEKFEESTLLNIGSLSRVIISYAILKLQQDGKLNVEDSILKYIPDFKKKDLASKIKVRHLMTHTSGLKDLPMKKMDSIPFLTIDDKANFELVKYANTLSFEPGNNYQISEQAFSALTIIIEKASGMPWQDYVKENIFRLPGMISTKFAGKPGTQTTETHAYRKINGNYLEYDEGETPKIYTASNGAIWSNVIDLRKLVYALQYCIFLNCENVKLADELLVPFNWYSPHRIPQTYCWYWNDIPSLETTNLSYQSKIGGFTSDIVRVPQNEIIVIIVTNNGVSYRNTVLEALKHFKYVK